MIRLIAAIDRKRGLGKNGNMPWNIPEDAQYFSDQTKTHGGHVLTGGVTFRNNYKSRPLPGRHNYIMTRQAEDIPGATVIRSQAELRSLLKEFKGEGKDMWVSGGAEVFQQIMDDGLADELYLTHIDADFGCDRFFPEYEDKFKLVEESEEREQNGFRFTYARYVRYVSAA